MYRRTDQINDKWEKRIQKFIGNCIWFYCLLLSIRLMLLCVCVCWVFNAQCLKPAIHSFIHKSSMHMWWMVFIRYTKRHTTYLYKKVSSTLFLCVHSTTVRVVHWNRPINIHFCITKWKEWVYKTHRAQNNKQPYGIRLF